MFYGFYLLSKKVSWNTWRNHTLLLSMLGLFRSGLDNRKQSIEINSPGELGKVSYLDTP